MSSKPTNKYNRGKKLANEASNSFRDFIENPENILKAARKANIDQAKMMNKTTQWRETKEINYKDNPREYDAIHHWLKYNFGKADKCESIDCLGKDKTFQWAKKKERPYSYNRDNFIKLCSSCHRKYDFTEETREKMRKYNTGKKISEETKRRMREAMKGKRMCAKTKAILLEIHRKPVAQIDDQGDVVKEWYSIREAARSIKCDYHAITYAIKMGRKSRGFYWKLIDKSIIRQHKEG